MAETPRLSEIVRSVTGKEAQARPSATAKARTRLTVKVMTQTLQALDELGGVDYLVDIGRREPRAFLGMLKGIMPQQVDVNDNSGLMGVLEARLNNARDIQARRLREIAAAVEKKPAINGEARQVNTP